MESDFYRVRGINRPVGRSTAELNYATRIVTCSFYLDCTHRRLDAGTLLSYLQNVMAWLDQNPDEGKSTLLKITEISLDNSIHQLGWH